MDGQCVKMVPSLAPSPLDNDKPGSLQHPEVLHDCATIQFRQCLAQGAGGLGTLLHQIEHPASGTMAKRLEKHVFLIFRHHVIKI